MAACIIVIEDIADIRAVYGDLLTDEGDEPHLYDDIFTDLVEVERVRLDLMIRDLLG